jgi:hypothetical protein
MLIIKLKIHPFGPLIVVKKQYIYIANMRTQNMRTQKKLNSTTEEGCS